MSEKKATIATENEAKKAKIEADRETEKAKIEAAKEAEKAKIEAAKIEAEKMTAENEILKIEADRETEKAKVEADRMPAENERLKIEAERSVLLDMSKRVTNIPERAGPIGSKANDRKNQRIILKRTVLIGTTIHLTKEIKFVRRLMIERGRMLR